MESNNSFCWSRHSRRRYKRERWTKKCKEDVMLDEYRKSGRGAWGGGIEGRDSEKVKRLGKISWKWTEALSFLFQALLNLFFFPQTKLYISPSLLQSQYKCLCLSLFFLVCMFVSFREISLCTKQWYRSNSYTKYLLSVYLYVFSNSSFHSAVVIMFSYSSISILYAPSVTSPSVPLLVLPSSPHQ